MLYFKTLKRQFCKTFLHIFQQLLKVTSERFHRSLIGLSIYNRLGGQYQIETSRRYDFDLDISNHGT